MSSGTHYYPIGILGKPWGEAEKATWLKNNSGVKREYKSHVLDKVDLLRDAFEVVEYGERVVDDRVYPLVSLLTKNWDEKKPNVLVTGGVHGYETSGVQGALLFLSSGEATKLEDDFNLVVCPCVCPWGYETVNRWTPLCLDPNRHFIEDSPVTECAQVMAFVRGLHKNFAVHFDLHETTDTDETEFMVARAAYNGANSYTPETIPDGFYIIGAADAKERGFMEAMIEGTKKVTHIAPADPQGNIIGLKAEGDGIVYSSTAGVCSRGWLGAEFCVTTEVYPDSPKVDDATCNQAQVACVVAGLNYVRNSERYAALKVGIRCA